MKKTYSQPQAKAAQMETLGIICGSQDIQATIGTGTDAETIGYGGVDTGGSLNPSSRRSVWGDEEEEEF